MRTIRTLLLTSMVLAITACASNVTKDQVHPSAVHIQSSSAAVAAFQPSVPSAAVLAMLSSQDAAKTAGISAHTAEVGADEGPTATESESDDLYAEVPVSDPWEGLNRKIHAFNNAVDKTVLRPLAVGYQKIAPEPVRAGISRFFFNLRMPVTVVNQVLQGRPGDAARSLGRFAVNTTGGIVGVFDPATDLGMPALRNEDFGQTLGTWGWRETSYLVLPLLGPRTVRDAIGMVIDQPLSPIAQIQDKGVASGLQTLEIVDVRTRLLPLDGFRRDAFDDYVFVRSAWIQQRNHQIQRGEPFWRRSHSAKR